MRTKAKAKTKEKDLTQLEKRNRILVRVLPRKNRFHKILKEEQINLKELNELFIAFSVASSVDKKLIANSFLVGISLRTREREISQTVNELIKRYKTRRRYSIAQRAYFEDCLIFGWSNDKERQFIAREARSALIKLKYKKEDALIKNNISNIESAINKLRKRKVDIDEVFNDITDCLEVDSKLRIDIFQIKKDAISKIVRVSQEIMRISKGQARPYLPRVSVEY